MGGPEAESKREGTEDWDKCARPVHTVTIARRFLLGKYPVTRGEYAAFAAETGRNDEPWSRPGFPQDDRHPVVEVSHVDAEAYLAWLSEKTGQTWRLPSEAEWEYAARAGTTTARYWGDAAGKPGEHAHFGESRGSASGTCAVGGFNANGFGLHEMLGNVWEWTADVWHNDYAGAPTDGSAWTDGGSPARVVRGGSWDGVARGVRAACRVRLDPADRGYNLGFRCARVQG
jgi:formylglycine-generating enzyme required for sulfatase activity